MLTDNSTKTLIALAALIPIMLFSSACSQKPEDLTGKSSQHIERAQAYHKQGQYRAAMIEARNAIKVAPQLPQAHIALAHILNTLAQGRQAQKQLDQIPEPQRAGSLYQITLTEALMAQGKYRSALKVLEQSEAMGVEKPLKYALLQAQALAATGEPDAATSHYRRALEIDPKHEEALLGLARIGSRADPGPELEKLEQLFPRSPQVLMLKARLAFKNGQLDQTESLLTQALTALPTTDIMTPQRATVLRALAEILVRQGHSAEALIYTKLLAEAFPGVEDAKAKYQTALEFFQQKDFVNAESSLKQLLEEYPQMEQAAQLMGIIKYIQGDLEQANQYFSESLDPETAPEKMTHIAAMTNMRLREPEKVLELLQDQIAADSNPQTLAMYGLAALSAREFERGEAALLRAVQADPEMTRLRLALAGYYNSKQPRQPEKALTQLKIAYAQNDSDAIIQTALAQYYLQYGEEAEALKLINSVLRKYPRADTSHILAGDYYRATRKLSKAVSHYQQAMQLNPGDSRSVLKLGLAHLDGRDHAAAKSAYRKAIGMEPNNKDGYKGLISAYELAGNPAAAVDEILGQSGSTSVPAAVLAEYYSRRNNFEQARLFEKKVIDIAPEARTTKALTSAIAYAEADYWLREENFDAARQASHRGLAATPRSVPLLRALSQTEIRATEYGEAKKVIEQVREFNPAVADHLAGDLHRSQGDTAAAIEAYETAWGGAPNDLVGSKLYGSLKSHNPSQASAFLSSWIEQRPNSIRARGLRGEEHIVKQDFEAAIRDFESILKSQANSPVVLNNLAWAYHQAGDNRALPTAKQAYELAPDNAAIADTYGWVLLKNGKKSAALKILRKAATLAPDNQEIRQHLKQAESAP